MSSPHKQSAIGRLLGRLAQFGLGSPTQWHRKGRRWQQRTGGGSTDMKPTKFLSRPIIARSYVGPKRNHSSRWKRRERARAC
jgi:hypothetical protein